MNTLFSFLASVPKVDEKDYNFSYSEITGLGEGGGIGRRDPSCIFKIGDTYYIYYSYNDDGVTTHGYFSTIYLAKSLNGIDWTELGEAIPKGGIGEWDYGGTYTPDVMILNGMVYVYYHGYETYNVDHLYPESVGAAYQTVADIETIPYTKYASNPLVEPSATSTDFDSLKVAGIRLMYQNNQIYFYYKGRQQGLTPLQTRHGLAIADDPLGPFVKQGVVYAAGHEVFIFRSGRKFRSLIDAQGFDTSLWNSLMESVDGRTGWAKIRSAFDIPFAAGYFREDNFVNQYNSKDLTWGLCTLYGGDGLPYLEKFTVT